MRADEELMAAYLAGDIAAFDELFRRYAGLLLRTLRRSLGRDDACDVVQQTFLQLHRSRHDYRPGAAVRPWIFTIALNLQRRHLRDARRRPLPLDDEAAAAPAVAARDITDDLPRYVRGAVARLPREQQRVIALHWFDGLPFQRVAETVGASLGAVKVRAHRGYLALRKIFEKEPHDGR